MLRRTVLRGSAGPAVTPSLTRAFFRSHREQLRTEHAKVQETLAQLALQHDAIEKKVVKHVDHWAVAGLTYLVAQTGLLFHWVYYQFDWNLVEPITYLLGYSVVWLSIGCFFKTGQEFTYDAIRNMIAERKRTNLWRRVPGGHTLESYALLRNTEEDLRKKIAQLEISALD